ncbi:MAG TPA: hypothetical protein VKX45_25495 [Bryobacteraceae bacterium]|jgi:hypothetical protein|nr:hypothetical protein [Bryobacteraceae bacterium]
MTGAGVPEARAAGRGRGLAVAAAAVALALLTFFQFPGHTWLQQDTQIYAAILEHRYDPAVLANDPLAQHPHVAFTLYDEIAIALRRATGLGFREVLEAQQIAARALGIWGLWMLAESLGLALWPAFAAAAVCSLGASIAGPAVLTFEYEPSPRAFAVPLLFCAMGLAARGRWMAASVAGSAAFLYHPPTTLPFWPVFFALAARRRQWSALAPPAAAAALLLAAARIEGDGNAQFFAGLGAFEEHLQRLRAPYVWVSMWPAARIAHEILLAGIAAGAWARVRAKASREASVLLLALAAMGLASMPVSWLLLERMKWSLVPQIQPMRALLFVALAAQLLAAVAGLRARGWLPAFAWLAVAFLIPVQAVWTEPWEPRRTAVALALAGLCAAARGFRGWRAELAPIFAAFFLFPTAGGVANYPKLHTPELAQLSAWARAATPRDSVFLFADAGRGLAPGIFRAEALRAVYVDWKSGGQVNYLKDFGGEWWFRWQQTLARGFRPDDWPRYSGLGIRYVVFETPAPGVVGTPVFTNSRYLVYRVQ